MPRLPELNPIHPSAPIRIKYQAKLDALIDEMQRSIMHWLPAAYRANEPHALVLYGQDASPARALQSAIDKLGRQWLRKFDTLAPKMADYFARAVKDRCDKSLAADLREGGFSVRFKMTAAMNDNVQAIVAENVALIKSIPRQHMLGVEGDVMRSVQTGRDLGSLTKDLVERHGVTKRRAAFIALDQNNKATSSLTNIRWAELGIEEAEWLHSAGGKVPRPDHVAYSRKRYKINKGAYISGEWIFPGQKPGCRCVGKAVIPGLEDLT